MGVSRVIDGKGEAVTIERVTELLDFLQGADIGGITNLKDRPQLSAEAASAVVYVLQEHMNLIPDRFENCDRCSVLFDSESEGDITDDKMLCDACAT